MGAGATAGGVGPPGRGGGSSPRTGRGCSHLAAAAFPCRALQLEGRRGHMQAHVSLARAPPAPAPMQFEGNEALLERIMVLDDVDAVYTTVAGLD